MSDTRTLAVNSFIAIAMTTLALGLIQGLGIEAQSRLGLENPIPGIAEQISEATGIMQFTPETLGAARGSMQLFFMVGAVLLLFPLYLAPQAPDEDGRRLSLLLKNLQWFLALSTALGYLPLPLSQMLPLRIVLSIGMFLWLKFSKVLPEWFIWPQLFWPPVMLQTLQGKRGPLAAAGFGIEYLAVGYALQSYPRISYLLMGVGSLFLVRFALLGWAHAESQGDSTTIFRAWTYLNRAYYTASFLMAAMVYYSLWATFS